MLEGLGFRAGASGFGDLGGFSFKVSGFHECSLLRSLQASRRGGQGRCFTGLGFRGLGFKG